FYFEHRHRHENMLLYEEEGATAGMLTMLPLRLLAAPSALPARYIFAVATRLSARGRGVSTRLLEEAHARAEAEGARATLLVPANEALYSFYGKRGYSTAFSVSEKEYTAADIPPAPRGGLHRACGISEYMRIRRQAFGGSGLFADWDYDALAYAVRAAGASGGGLLCLRRGQGEAAALCEPRDGGVRVTELASLGMGAPDCMALIHARFGAQRYLLRMPQGALPGAPDRPFAMVRWIGDAPPLQGGPPYFALAKD
ncbi:MAG TPA: GNAT family N-acetyltransferase, partial [Candidatus Limnocylindria bacterium]|nr:GNAT family N-acetyltransferase [Candidatus Limnocylindria bacterium]